MPPNHKFEEKSTYDDHFKVRTKEQKPAAGRSLAIDGEVLSIAHEGDAGEWKWPMIDRSKSVPRRGEPAGQKITSKEFDVHTLGMRKLTPRVDHPDAVMVVYTEAELAEKLPSRVLREKAAGRPQATHPSGKILGFTHTGVAHLDKAPLKDALQPDASPIIKNDHPSSSPTRSAYRSHFTARPGVGPEPVERPKPADTPRVPAMAATVPPPASEPLKTPRRVRHCRPYSNPRSGAVPGEFSGPANGIEELTGDEPRGPKAPLPARLQNFPWGKVDNYQKTTMDEALAKFQARTLQQQAHVRSELDQQVAARRQRKQREQDEEKRFHSLQEADIRKFNDGETARSKALEERVRLTQKQLDAQVREAHKLQESLQAEKREFEHKALRENAVIQQQMKDAEIEKDRKVRAEMAEAWQQNLVAQADKKSQKVLEKAEDKQTAANWGKILADQDTLRDRNKEDIRRRHQPKGCVESRSPTRPGPSTARDPQAEARALQEQKVLDAREHAQEEAKLKKLRTLREDVSAFNGAEKLSRTQERQRQRDKKEEIRSAVEKKALAARQAEAAEKANVRAKNVAHRQELEEQIKSRPPPGPRGVMTDDEARLNRRLLGLIEASEASR